MQNVAVKIQRMRPFGRQTNEGENKIDLKVGCAGWDWTEQGSNSGLW
jgi:hypothetical protein